MEKHRVLITDAATIQGVERDIMLVGILPIGRPGAQNQHRDIQRANVALSRARDQMYLIRNIDAADVAPDDMKSKIIKFFDEENEQNCMAPWAAGQVDLLSEFYKVIAGQLKHDLESRGFAISPIGAVWTQAYCVELPGTDARAAICVEIAGESEGDWDGILAQQRALERVGWHCYRVDAFFLSNDHENALAKVLDFLKDAGLEAQVPKDAETGTPVPSEIVTTQEINDGTDDVGMKGDDRLGIEAEDAGNIVPHFRRSVSASTSSNDSDHLSSASGMHDEASLQHKKRTGGALHGRVPQKIRHTRSAAVKSEHPFALAILCFLSQQVRVHYV